MKDLFTTENILEQAELVAQCMENEEFLKASIELGRLLTLLEVCNAVEERKNEDLDEEDCDDEE